jgi:hypothetical protein
MKVKLKIKKGHHSPSFFSRLWYFRFWVFKVPKIVEISNVKITHEFEYWMYRYLTIAGRRARSSTEYLFYLSQLKEQVNKIGGIAYGLPKYSKKYKSWIHPNSYRLGYNLHGEYKEYEYYDGNRFIDDHEEKKVGIEWYIGDSNDYYFAYSLLPFFGGVCPAPCDIIVEYEIKFKF